MIRSTELSRAATVNALRGLAGLFIAPVSAEVVQSLRDGERALELMELGRLFALAPGVRRMRAALEAVPTGAAGAVVLARCHALLFSGADGPNMVPPCESAFTAPAGRLFGDAEDRMHRLLATLDLHVSAAAGGPADHVGVELAVLAELAAATAPGATGHRRALVAAMRGWLGAFADACAARDTTGFYAGAALLAAALVELEAGRLVGGEFVTN